MEVFFTLIRDNTDISYFVTTTKFQLVEFVADLDNSFCKEVYVVAFLKVLRQQTIGEIAISIACFGQIMLHATVTSQYSTVRN